MDDTRVRQLASIGSPRKSPLPADLPQVIIHNSARRTELITNQETNKLYQMAKYGDSSERNIAAALEWVELLYEPEEIERLQNQYKDSNPVILPVVGVEKEDGHVNHIPIAMAAVLSERTGWEISTDIMNVSTSGRKGVPAPLNRFVKQAIFEGEVEKGRNYIILDDHINFGGTVRNLADHIIANGGNVIGCMALAGKSTGDYYLQPMKRNTGRVLADRNIIRDFDALHSDFFGHDLPSRKDDKREQILFTNSELTAIAHYPGGVRKFHEDLVNLVNNLDHAIIDSKGISNDEKEKHFAGDNDSSPEGRFEPTGQEISWAGREAARRPPQELRERAKPRWQDELNSARTQLSQGYVQLTNRNTDSGQFRG